MLTHALTHSLLLVYYQHFLSGCSKCLKEFPRDASNKPNYAGYNFDEWVPRSADRHREQATQVHLAPTETAKSELASKFGVRYSELLRLPYFDPIQSHVVDPMHNLLLGTAKHVFRSWVSSGVITDNKIEKIDESMTSKLIVPSERGRITQSMSLYKTMKSDEWKNWVLHYSLFCLKDVLPKSHFNMWQVYVRSCYLLIQTSISLEEARLAHKLLVLFCNTYQGLMGDDNCTPNMHMHLHLLGCVMDFGPVYSFWCYSFERYNGMLGAYHTNNHSLSITIMRKFISSVQIVSSYQQLNVEELPSLHDLNLLSNKEEGQCNQTKLDKIRRNDVANIADASGLATPITVAKLCCLPADDRTEIGRIVSNLFRVEVLDVPKFAQSFERIRLGREIISCRRYRGGTNRDYVVIYRDTEIEELRPAFVKNFLKIEISISALINTQENIEFVFARVDPLKEHPKKDWFGRNCPMKLWSTEKETSVLILVHTIQRKCSFYKGLQRFDRFELSNGRQSNFRGSDTVYYII